MSVIVDESRIKWDSYYLFIIQFLSFSYFIYNRKYTLFDIFSPSFFTLIYTSFTFILGSFMLPRFDALYGLSEDYSNLEYYRYIVIYFLLCNYVVFSTIITTKLEKKVEFINKSTSNTVGIVLALLSLVFFSFAYIDLSFLGASEGSINYPFILMSVILVTLFNRNKKVSIRLLFYIPIILFIIIIRFESKREIFFLILTILIIESAVNNVKVKINIKNLVIGFSIIIASIYIIIVSSILRGYGGYNATSIWQANNFIFVYLFNPDFIIFAMNNFEISYGYMHSLNGVEKIINGEIGVLFGETFLKVFFIPIPRYIFEFKPDSMVSIYTAAYSSSLRNSGGSLPINLYSELFANFHIFGLIALYGIFYTFQRYYYKLYYFINDSKIGVFAIVLVYLSATFVQFFRGAGLDLWIVYLIISLPLAIIIKLGR